jgi:RNA polymerase sigma factor (sigma-70 family)
MSQLDRHWLTSEETAAIEKHLEFYRSLETGERLPETDAQKHFVAVCRSEAIAETIDEIAYLKHRASSTESQQLVQDSLSKLTPRKRAILKLRTGCAPLTDGELNKVLPASKKDAVDVKQRTLDEVGNMFGVTRERIRQIESSCLRRLKLQWNADRTELIPQST